MCAYVVLMCARNICIYGCWMRKRAHTMIIEHVFRILLAHLCGQTFSPPFFFFGWKIYIYRSTFDLSLLLSFFLIAFLLLILFDLDRSLFFFFFEPDLGRRINEWCKRIWSRVNHQISVVSIFIYEYNIRKINIKIIALRLSTTFSF